MDDEAIEIVTKASKRELPPDSVLYDKYSLRSGDKIKNLNVEKPKNVGTVDKGNRVGAWVFKC